MGKARKRAGALKSCMLSGVLALAGVGSLTFVADCSAGAAEAGASAGRAGRAVAAGAVVTPDMRAPRQIASKEELGRWMTYYYLHPQPDLLVPAVLYAESQGFLTGDARTPLVAFISHVFAQNPARIAGWSQALSAMQEPNRTALWTALWWSATKEGKDALDGIMKGLPPKAQTFLQTQMAHPPQPFDQQDISTPAVLDELWASWSATGEERYVRRLMTVLPWAAAEQKDLNKMTIGGAARWSLTSNAQQHPRVLKLCMQVRDNDPQLRPYLEPIITAATSPEQKSTAK
jgi:hypothetical protein